MTQQFSPRDEWDSEQDRVHRASADALVSQLVDPDNATLLAGASPGMRTTDVDQLPVIALVLSMQHPDLHHTVNATVPIPLEMLTSQLLTPQREANLTQFRTALGNSVNQLLSAWVGEYRRIKRPPGDAGTVTL